MPCFWVHLYFSLLQLVCCWTPVVCFFSCYCILQLDDFYLVLSYIFNLSVEVLLCSSILPNSGSIFMTITLNSLSVELLFSISLRFFFFPYILSWGLIWSIFLCFFILLDSLCWFLYIRYNSQLSQSWSRRWNLLFNPVLALGCLKLLWFSKQPILFLMAPNSWGCAMTHQCPKGRISLNT